VIAGEQLLLNAFDVALMHIRANTGPRAAAGLPWVGERITPAGTVGAETWRYTAGRLGGDYRLSGGAGRPDGVQYHRPECDGRFHVAGLGGHQRQVTEIE